MAEGVLSADQQEALDRIGGIQQAATLLMQRLYEKDPRRWLQVVAVSPADIVPWPDQPNYTELGAKVKAYIERTNVATKGQPVELHADGTVRPKMCPRQR